MKKLFVIGGMGAGKSTVAHVLESLGLPRIDLDEVARDVLADPDVGAELAEAFGEDVLDAQGTVNRSTLAARAFVSPEATAQLNAITQPRIADAFYRAVAALAHDGVTEVVVEYPLFPQERAIYVEPGDELIAIVAPLNQRIARAVAAGFAEADVRRRIAAQADDGERAQAADVIFVNDGTPEELIELVQSWWRERNPANLMTT